MFQDHCTRCDYVKKCAGTGGNFQQRSPYRRGDTYQIRFRRKGRDCLFARIKTRHACSFYMRWRSIRKYQDIRSPSFCQNLCGTVMRNRFLKSVFFSAVFFLLTAGLSAETWYRSNPAGMALERIASRTVALHSEWALLVETQNQSALPSLLRPYYNSAFTIERRFLYRRGVLNRRQWIFRDRGGVTRINASLPPEGKTSEDSEENATPPFVEVFSADHTLTESYQYNAEGKRYVTRYS